MYYAQTKAPGFYNVIIPIVISVFAVYLTIGMSLGILPELVQHDLKFDGVVVGLVVGLQSLATLLTRAYSGKITDTRGAGRSKLMGVLLVLVSGMVYILAATISSYAVPALALILLSRIIHGVSESMFVTGALTWGIGLVGQQRAGKVMTWNGIAMYAGIAAGAPLGIAMNEHCGAATAFAVMIVLALVSWLATVKIPVIPADPSHVRTPFYKVISLVAGQGAGLAFSSMGFACIASFIALLFAEKNWGNASMAFVCFGTFYILTRIFFSSLPDKFGGYSVALVSLVIEAAGQLLIGFSTSPMAAIAGCALTGTGFSLIFPSLGILAIKKTTPQIRGTALGAYAAFFDLSLGVAGPLAGLVAGWFNYQAVYIFGSVSCLLAILVLNAGRKNATA